MISFTNTLLIRSLPFSLLSVSLDFSPIGLWLCFEIRISETSVCLQTTWLPRPFHICFKFQALLTFQTSVFKTPYFLSISFNLSRLILFITHHSGHVNNKITTVIITFWTSDIVFLAFWLAISISIIGLYIVLPWMETGCTKCCWNNWTGSYVSPGGKMA